VRARSCTQCTFRPVLHPVAAEPGSCVSMVCGAGPAELGPQCPQWRRSELLTVSPQPGTVHGVCLAASSIMCYAVAAKLGSCGPTSALAHGAGGGCAPSHGLGRCSHRRLAASASDAFPIVCCARTVELGLRSQYSRLPSRQSAVLLQPSLAHCVRSGCALSHGLCSRSQAQFTAWVRPHPPSRAVLLRSSSARVSRRQRGCDFDSGPHH
jgi:hypothetical protein